MKKIIIVIFAIVLIIGGLMVGVMIRNDKAVDEQLSKKRSGAVVFFSATNNTKGIAEKVADVTNSDIFEIKAKEPYSTEDLDYNKDDCRANKEQKDESSRPEIESTLDLDEYDVIYLGYPIWWNDTPKIILTFIDSHKLSGKTVIPFCTSGSSSIDNSMKNLRKYNSTIKWIDGKRFDKDATKDDIKKWIDSINYNTND